MTGLMMTLNFSAPMAIRPLAVLIHSKKHRARWVGASLLRLLHLLRQ